MLFGFEKNDLIEVGAVHTASEIAQQPRLWLKTLELIESRKDELQNFIEKVISSPNFDVILIGAGTSEYVGTAAKVTLNKILNFNVHAYGTTDLVVEPEKYLPKSKPTLLISFARSGNSPESLGAIKVANQICDNVYHVIITCNDDGGLAKYGRNADNCCIISLPQETNDQSFAMTSSFSCMYLACLLLFRLNKLTEMRKEIMCICDGAQRLISENWSFLSELVEDYDFDRIVFLGSGALKGVAQESALKMLELNAGKVATLFDTPMGFRHGPKFVINDDTLTVVYVSDDDYVRRYEADLIRELNCQRNKNKLLVVQNVYDEELEKLADFYYAFRRDKKPISSEMLALQDIVLAQMLAVTKSLKNGVRPDNPCPSGELSRVVKGVVLYD